MLLSLNQIHHQLFTQAAVLGKQMHQTRLLQHHLRRHADQLAVFTQRFRIAGQTDNANNLSFQTQRQVDPLTDPVQMFRHGVIDVDHAPLREHQQRPFVQFPNTLTIAAADNAPAGIHYVDIGINDAHGSRHDILRHFGIKMPASHITLP